MAQTARTGVPEKAQLGKHDLAGQEVINAGAEVRSVLVQRAINVYRLETARQPVERQAKVGLYAVWFGGSRRFLNRIASELIKTGNMARATDANTGRQSSEVLREQLVAARLTAANRAKRRDIIRVALFGAKGQVSPIREAAYPDSNIARHEKRPFVVPARRGRLLGARVLIVTTSPTRPILAAEEPVQHNDRGWGMPIPEDYRVTGVARVPTAMSEPAPVPESPSPWFAARPQDYDASLAEEPTSRIRVG